MPFVSLSVGVACVAAMLAGCASTPTASSFELGMGRSEIIEHFGQPEQQQNLVKRDEGIWGAIEEFWSQVPVGSSVEIWRYPVEGGSVELYFVDDSEVVDGTGFAPEGAVFEGSD